MQKHDRRAEAWLRLRDPTHGLVSSDQRGCCLVSFPTAVHSRPSVKDLSSLLKGVVVVRGDLLCRCCLFQYFHCSHRYQQAGLSLTWVSFTKLFLHSITLLYNIRWLSRQDISRTTSHSLTTSLRVVNLRSFPSPFTQQLFAKHSVEDYTNQIPTMKSLTMKYGLLALSLLQASNAHMGITNIYIDGADQVHKPSLLFWYNSSPIF